MMKRARIAALAFAAGTLTAADANTAPYSLDPLVAAAIAAPGRVSYRGTVEVVRMGSRTADASVYRVEHRAPGLTRHVYVAPSTLAGDWVVAEGDAIYSVDPKRRRVLESRNDGADDSSAVHANYALLRENYHTVRAGSDVVAGRRTIDLALVSNDTQRTTMLIAVDAVTKCVLEKKSFTAGGAPVEEVRFEAITYSSAPPAADFALPQSYTVVRAASFTPSQRPDRVLGHAGFVTRAPRALPGGFSPVDGNIIDLHGVRTMHLLYSDGLRTVSLFESAASAALESTRLESRTVIVAGRSAQYAEDGPTALLTWSDGRLYYTLVGEVGIVDLSRLAEAIGP
jgi:negative regulator of sigma E activity